MSGRKSHNAINAKQKLYNRKLFPSFYSQNKILFRNERQVTEKVWLINGDWCVLRGNRYVPIIEFGVKNDELMGKK